MYTRRATDLRGAQSNMAEAARRISISLVRNTRERLGYWSLLYDALRHIPRAHGGRGVYTRLRYTRGGFRGKREEARAVLVLYSVGEGFCGE